MQAISLLENEIRLIQSVNDWAKTVGCSRSTLIRLIKTQTEQTPNEIMRIIRYNRIIMLTRNNPKTTAYAVAVDSGLKDDKSLYKFLKRHYSIRFTELRRRFF
jgi:AraC-like DNA-binding protein